MQAFNFKKQLCAIALLLLIGAGVSAHAATFSVSCGGASGLTSINAAIKLLQNNQSMQPATVNVSGACHENIVVQSIDRLTLNAVNGASITDASNNTLDVIDVIDSRDVTITGFTINGGSNGSGIACFAGSLCLLTNDTVQGASAGIGVFSLGQARVHGVKLLNNDLGLQVNHGGTVIGDATMQGNNRGIHMVLGAVLNIAANITGSHELGIFATTSATLDCQACVITNNAAGGVLLQDGSNARFTDGFTITGNGGPGVALNELASALFGSGIVTGNGGGLDVACNSPTSGTSGANTNIGGGSTNCPDNAPVSTIAELTSAHVDPSSGNTLVSAFILTDSADRNCLVTFSESNNAVPGMAAFCGVRTPSLYGGRPGVLIHVLFPAPVVNNLILSLTVHQNAAKMYGQPVLCTAANGC